jgi:DNA polymerase-3 subunit delta'
VNFKHIIGHNKNKEILQRLISRSRVPHALLFSGLEGVGKRMMAVAVAAALNCKDLRPEGACGECQSCVKLKAGTHPLIKFIGSPKNEKKIEIEFSGENKVSISNLIPAGTENKKKITQKINIDQVREIIRESSLKPYGSDKKVFIIDDISQTSTEALNCLLKILEEPPQDTYFILITSREELLFQTIISRCQKFEFSSLSYEEMKVFAKEKISGMTGIEEEDKLILVSYGSPGKLLSYMDLKNVVFSAVESVSFFESVRKWFGDTTECLSKLKILLEMEGVSFRGSPTEEGFQKLGIIENTINDIKKNANAELAVSNMFIKIGRVNFI